MMIGRQCAESCYSRAAKRKRGGVIGRGGPAERLLRQDTTGFIIVDVETHTLKIIIITSTSAHNVRRCYENGVEQSTDEKL